jgi:predicted peptidase
MATRRELFPLIAGAAGSLTAAPAALARESTIGPELRRVSYQSARTGKERDYLVYLPEGHAKQKNWPVMLFLHGNGERGDGKAELDYVLAHGPLYEAWIQKRNLPFIIISPQLPMFGQGEVDYIKNRTPAQIPRRRPDGADARPDERLLRAPVPMPFKPPADELPTGPEGPVDGWNLIADELIRILDTTVRDFRGDPRRLYLTGLSYGGFGSWFLAARNPEKFAAVAPVVGYGHPEHAAPITRAKLPVWCFAGGLDPVVEARYFYTAFNRLEALGHPSARLTNHEELGHFTWVRVYGGEDLYAWMLAHSR